MNSKDIIPFVHRIYWRLQNIVRFNSMPRIHTETVAEHTYSVAFLVLLVAEKLKEDNATIDVLKALKMSLLHDVEEIYSGDIVSYLKQDKKFNDALNVLLDKASDIILEGDIKHKELWKEFREGKIFEAKIVQFCDKISTLIYLEEEMRFGNSYSEEVYNRIIKWLDQEFPEQYWRQFYEY